MKISSRPYDQMLVVQCSRRLRSDSKAWNVDASSRHWQLRPTWSTKRQPYECGSISKLSPHHKMF